MYVIKSYEGYGWLMVVGEYWTWMHNKADATEFSSSSEADKWVSSALMPVGRYIVERGDTANTSDELEAIRSGLTTLHAELEAHRAALQQLLNVALCYGLPLKDPAVVEAKRLLQ